MTEAMHFQNLRKVLEDMAPDGRFALAYSGGLDSRFLAFAAKRLGLEPILLHVAGPHIAPSETAEALERAAQMGLEVRVLSFTPPLEDLARARKLRCYVCKRAIFAELRAEAERIRPGLPLCDGTNQSDLGVYRPGMKALTELGVLSPLAQAGLAKPDIRRIGRMTGFPDPEQRARPCLLTRFPYGAAPSARTLERLAAAETLVETALAGSRGFRIRVPEPGKPILHLEASQDKEKDEALLSSLLKSLREGFGGIAGEVVPTLSGYYDRKN